MAKKPDRGTGTTGLRQQAEALLRTTKREVAAMPLKDVQQLVYELQVYEIELEMQNEELRRIQIDLEAARDRYVDLYDFAPAGHLTLDTHGKIVEANLRAGALLGVNRKELLGQSLAQFIAASDEGTFHRHCQDVVKTGTRQICEVFLRIEAGVSGKCIVVESCAIHEGLRPITHWRTALLDITERKQAEIAFQNSGLFLQSIVENIPNMVFVKDAKQLRFIQLNRAGEELLGHMRTELIGKSNHDIFLKEEADFFTKTDQETLRTGTLVDIPEAPIHTKRKGLRFVHTRKIPLLDEMGCPQYLLGISEDITERKHVEEVLQASEAFTQAVLNSLFALICVLDKDGVVLRTNDAWRAVACRNSNRFISPIDVGQNYLDLCLRAIADGDSTAQAVFEGIDIVLRGSQPTYGLEYLSRSSEEERWFLLRVTPLKESEGVVVSHTDISERVRMQRDIEGQACLLREKQEELESLARKLIEAQEQERKRVARELHDDFNQRLAALSVELENLERAPVAPPEPVVRQLEMIRKQVVSLSDDLHSLAYRLHPSLLDHVGLEAAARDHIGEFTKRTGLPVRFIAREVPKTLSLEIATNLFRVMQESLQNVSKHAEATEVTVKLSGSSKGIGVSVRDNGKGFDLKDKAARMNGLGLVSMEERARGLGGSLRVHSLQRNGTKICTWIPRAPEGA
ncbi:MAG: PAS domain-containing protein [Nitrospiraceae bacterium]